jgi:hypothetical protein
MQIITVSRQILLGQAKSHLLADLTERCLKMPAEECCVRTYKSKVSMSLSNMRAFHSGTGYSDYEMIIFIFQPLLYNFFYEQPNS